MKKFRFISVFLAVLVTLAGFTALQPTPVSAGGNSADLITFGRPDIRVSPKIEVVLTDGYSFGNFRVYKFTLKNNSTELAEFLSGFSDQSDIVFVPVECQWWTILFLNGKIISLNSQRFQLEAGKEYTLSLTVQILHAKGKATIFPYLVEVPKLHDVKFAMSDGVVNVSWRSSGNANKEPVRITINRFGGGGASYINIPDYKNGYVWNLQYLPRGEYYLKIFFLSSSGIEEIYSPLYFSTGATPVSTAIVQLATDNPAAIRPGTQVPLMRFQVTASSDIVLDEIYFGFFYDAGGAEANAENFTLWNGPVLISQGENLNPQTVKFSQFLVVMSANSSVVLGVRGDVIGPNGATMKMSLENSSPAHLQGLPLDTSLNVLRP